MLFIIPELIFICCFLIENRRQNITKKENIIIAVVSQTLIAIYFLLYLAFEKQIVNVIFCSVAVLNTFISYTDIKEKLISVPYCVVIALVGFAMSVFRTDVAVYNPVLTAIAFFLITKLVKKICKGQIGDGDIYLITGYAAAYGYPLIIKLMFSSLFVGLIIGLCGVLFKKLTMKTEIPFAPFMLIGSLLFEIIRRV